MDIFYNKEFQLEYIYNKVINERSLYIDETIIYQQLLITFVKFVCESKLGFYCP